MRAFGIWIEMLPVGKFHGGLYSHETTCFRGGVLSQNTIFSMCLCDSRNLFHEGDSHEITNFHEIHFMAVTHEIIS